MTLAFRAAIQFTWTSVLLPALVFAQPFPNTGKFNTYGGPQDSVHTEISGTTCYVEGGMIWVRLDDQYQHLAITGNSRIPTASDDPAGRYSQCKNALTAAGVSFKNVIKIEASTTCPSGVQSDPCIDGYPATNLPPTMPAPGQRIFAKGQLSVEYGHTMWHDLCTDGFVYPSNDGKRVCYGHTELHPFQLSGFALNYPIQSGDARNYVLTFVAPTADRFYSMTFLGNFSEKGQLYTPSIRYWPLHTARLPTPPKCPSCTNLLVTETTIHDIQNNDPKGPVFSKQITYVGNNIAELKVQMNAASVSAPSIFQEEVHLSWQCEPKTCSELGKNCGQIEDCGGTLTCGDAACGSGSECINNVCSCVPLDPMAVCMGKCSQVSDGCGGSIACANFCDGRCMGSICRL